MCVRARIRVRVIGRARVWEGGGDKKAGAENVSGVTYRVASIYIRVMKEQP